MDKETLDIQHQLKMVGDLVEHDAWGIVERSLRERIDLIQNLSEIKIDTPEKLFIELQARKHAVDIIAGWLHDIAGTAEVARQSLQEEKPSYIITKE
jgi:hypothetical protein